MSSPNPVKEPDEIREFVSRLCRLHGDELLRFLERILGRKVLAEEIAQETYLKLYRLCRPEDVVCPEALLFDVAAKLAFSHLRRSRAEAALVTNIDTAAHVAEVERVIDEHSHPDRRAASEQSLQWLSQVIERLPAALKQALAMHYIEQLSYREIGRRLGISAKAAEKRVFRALTHSRRRLAALGILWLGPN